MERIRMSILAWLKLMNSRRDRELEHKAWLTVILVAMYMLFIFFFVSIIGGGDALPTFGDEI